MDRTSTLILSVNQPRMDDSIIYRRCLYNTEQGLSWLSTFLAFLRGRRYDSDTILVSSSNICIISNLISYKEAKLPYPHIYDTNVSPNHCPATWKIHRYFIPQSSLKKTPQNCTTSTGTAATISTFHGIVESTTVKEQQESFHILFLLASARARPQPWLWIVIISLSRSYPCWDVDGSVAWKFLDFTLTGWRGSGWMRSTCVYASGIAVCMVQRKRKCKQISILIGNIMTIFLFSSTLKQLDIYSIEVCINIHRLR